MPLPGQARVLHLRFQERTKESLLELVRVVSSGCRLDLSSADFVRSIDTSLRFSPAVYAIHWLLSEAVQAKRVRSALTALQRLLSLGEAVYAPAGLTFGTLDGDLLEAAVRDYLFGAEGPRDPEDGLPEIHGLDETQLAREWPMVEEAIAVLGRCDEGVLDELDEYATDFRLFGGRVVRGITSVRVFGAIHLRIPEPELSASERVVYYVDHLTHETSHLQLHALMVEDPLILNDDTERFPAPIRVDLRPLFGIYHGTFVLSRIVRVFGLWRDATGDALVDRELRTAISRFDKGIGVLRQHATLTPNGSFLLDEMQALVAPWH
jgi:hypothetical protein